MKNNVTGIYVGATRHDYRMYIVEQGNKTKPRYACDRSIIQQHLIREAPKNTNTSFVIVFPGDSAEVDERVMNILNILNAKQKIGYKLSLYYIGKPSPLSGELGAQPFSDKDEESAYFTNVDQALEKTVRKQLNALYPSDKPEQDSNLEQAYENSEESTGSMSDTSMVILGGFIFALGIAAVAIAFTVLNAATFGVAGSIVAGIGIFTGLTGLGMIGKGARFFTPQPSSDDSEPAFDPSIQHSTL